MSVGPEEIRRKEFKNSLRGYNADEVDDFLDAVADALEDARSQNARMTDELRGLRERLDQFEKLEESIRATLSHAERSAEDLRESARREAGVIEQEAEERANKTLADAAKKAEKVEQSFEALRRARQLFVADFRHLLKSHLEIMESEGIASFGSVEDLLAGRARDEGGGAAPGDPVAGDPTLE
ncbi:MAG: DivIVA domain-containing protein, partial [Rubrobacter sp.]|nr:DivIVA domain-containing protein [Rubrobacter sp.]